MSFALDDNSKELTNEVINAAQKGIVLICSTADEGNNKTVVWPASYTSETIDIAACDENGNPASYSNPRAKYYFQGRKYWRMRRKSLIHLK